MTKVKLSDICRIKYGKDHKKLNDGNIPVFGSGGIVRYADAALSNGPSVLIPRKGTLGNLFYADEPFWTVDTLFWTEIDTRRVHPKYLYYTLKNKNLAALNIGTAVPSLSVDVLNEIELDLPKFEVQSKVVHLLNLLDGKIDFNNQINDYLEEFVVAMFGEFYVSKWGNELPEGWSYQQVDNIAEKVAMGPFGSNIKVDTFVDEGVSIISGAHLKGLLLEESDYNHITEEHANRLNNSMVYPGDIVFTHAGNIGQASLITEWSNEPKYIISQRQFYLRCDKSKLLPEIPALYFHTRMGKHVLTANSTSTGVPSIAQPSSYLKSIELLVPDMPSQQRFVKTTKPLFHSIVANRNEIDCLGRLRDLLLPKLMSGEIDVSQVELPTQLNNHLFDC